MGVSEKVCPMDGGAHVGSEKWAIAGIAVKSPLKPIFTKPMEKRDAEEEEEEEEQEECSTTPSFAESRIPSRLPCPPAPKKPKPAANSSRCHYRGVREFFSPPDLETIFIRRVEGA